MNGNPLDLEKRHLSSLIEVIQRCVFFLDAAGREIEWPLTGDMLAARKKDRALFGALAAINERFGKLQDILGAAMRHSMILASEPAETFLKVIVFHEKISVLESAEKWQLCRSARNLAAHRYETDYDALAEHFNILHELEAVLYRTAFRFVAYCREQLGVGPASEDFVSEFAAISKQY